MNTIKRDVYVLKNTIKIPIEITEGTDMIGIEFTVRDFTIPATAAVVAYANHKSMSRPNSALCELADNAIAFSPSSGFFAVGMNELQIRIINEDKTLVSFAEKVKCSGSAGFPDDEEEGKESATEAGKYAASASESAVTAEKTKEDALRKVGEKKQEAIEAIQNQEETSVGKITTHTDGEIQRIQNQAAESKGELEQTITNAGVSKEELDESIQTASDTKTALDKSVELVGTAKTELDTSIREARTAKIALDESTETAETVQDTLSATVKQAGALDTSLGEEIKTGTQLKTDLTASGEKAVQDIQTAGSEQLGKMQAVAEAFIADREQVATNKEDIGSLKEDLLLRCRSTRMCLLAARRATLSPLTMLLPRRCAV